MSETTTDPKPPATTTTNAQADSLYSQAFIYAMFMMPIGAGVLVGAFKYLSPEVASTLAGTALALVLGNPSQYFFGAAKHTTTIATPQGMTTTTVTPATTTTVAPTTTVTPPATTTTTTPP